MYLFVKSNISLHFSGGVMIEWRQAKKKILRVTRVSSVAKMLTFICSTWRQFVELCVGEEWTRRLREYSDGRCGRPCEDMEMVKVLPIIRTARRLTCVDLPDLRGLHDLQLLLPAARMWTNFSYISC